MSAIAQALKSEIARVARQQVRVETAQLKKASSRYRHEIAELKRQVSVLQRQVAQRPKAAAAAIDSTQTEETRQVRFSAARLKQHRLRLGLSAENFGKLFGVSGQTVYNWEGGTRPSRAYMVMISNLRKLGKREAAAVVAARS